MGCFSFWNIYIINFKKVNIKGRERIALTAYIIDQAVFFREHRGHALRICRTIPLEEY